VPDSIVVNVQTIHPRYVRRQGTSIGRSGGWSSNVSRTAKGYRRRTEIWWAERARVLGLRGGQR
jgi:hypothetical protein